MTRAEYEKKYGTKPVISTSKLDTTPAPIRITKQEYFNKYGELPDGTQPQSFFGSALNPFGKANVDRLKDIPSDVGEAFKGATAAARQGVDNFTSGVRGTLGYGEEGVSKTTQATSALAAPFSAAANIAGEAALGTAKLFTTDEFEKAFAENVEDVVKAAVEANIPLVGKSAKEVYENMTPQNKFTLSKVLAPVANVVTSVSTAGATGVVKEGIKEGLSKTVSIGDKLGELRVNRSVGKIDKNVQRIATEIGKVEEKYTPLRKANKYSKDVEGSRLRIAQSNVLENAVGENGLLRTEDAYKAYKTIPLTKTGDSLDDLEDIVRQNLVNEGKTINVNEVLRELKLAVSDSKLEGADLVKAMKGLENEIKGLSMRADGLDDIPLDKIQDAKINTTTNINFQTPPETATYRKTLARVYKEIVENKSDLDVKAVNGELAKYYRDLERLKALDGRKVEGGKLGKYSASLAGTAIGMGAGSAGGGFGAAIGGIVGGEVGAMLKGKSMARTFQNGGDGTVPSNQILADAKTRAQVGKVTNLKVPDEPRGAPKGVAKTKEILKTEGQIKKNVEAQKKAIKAGDFTLVATLKEIYQLLLEKLRGQIRFARDNIKDEGGYIKNPLGKDSQSIPLQRNQRNTTTPANTNSISSKVPNSKEDVNTSVGDNSETNTSKADVEDDIVVENLMRLDGMDVEPRDTMRLYELKRIANKRALTEDELLEAQQIIESVDGKLPEVG